MATANIPATKAGEPSGVMRLSNIREGDDIMTETLPIIHVISDSWMILRKTGTERMESNALMKHIDIKPHRVAVSVSTAE